SSSRLIRRPQEILFDRCMLQALARAKGNNQADFWVLIKGPYKTKMHRHHTTN
ncbi:Hypothetical predicted protein, partial [Marmota monax]